MTLGAGVVGEIYPGIDRFVVHFAKARAALEAREAEQRRAAANKTGAKGAPLLRRRQSV